MTWICHQCGTENSDEDEYFTLCGNHGEYSISDSEIDLQDEEFEEDE